MLEKIKEYVESHKQIHKKNLESKTDIINFLKEYTKNINKEMSLKQMLFLVYRGYKDWPRCKLCDNYVMYNSNSNVFFEWCSKECGYKIMGQRMKETKIKKYGKVNTVTSDFLMNKYGVVNVSQLPGVGNKISTTKKSKSIEEKIETNRKREQTVMERYGKSHYRKTIECHEKIKKTCLEKYGVTSSLNIPHVRSKMIELIKRNSYNNYILHDPNATPMFTIDEYINSTTKWLKFKCKKCKEIYDGRYDSGVVTTPCPKCSPINHGSSNIEQEVLKFVKTICSTEVLSNQKILYLEGHTHPFEIDIYVPELKIGIEFNGLYYHSGKTNLHRDKHLAAEKIGIQLITITDYDWLKKCQLVKSMLRRKLQTSKYRIMARKCSIQSISPQIKDRFLHKYHLQGPDKSSIRLGLYYKNRLVALMSFGKNRFSPIGGHELLRYCTISNFIIQGGAGKLLSYFEKKFKPDRIVSYAKCDYSNGGMYYKLGFKLSHRSSPNYFWNRHNEVLSRIQTQKHRLPKLLGEQFDPTLTEIGNMTNAGWSRYFDSGNLVFVKEYSI